MGRIWRSGAIAIEVDQQFLAELGDAGCMELMSRNTQEGGLRRRVQYSRALCL
jgi:hypothetical protein